MKDFYRSKKLTTGKVILVNEFGTADVRTVDGLTEAEFVEYEAITAVKHPERVNKRRVLREFVKGGKMYKIIRFFRDDGRAEVRETGLTLKQAQAHCRRKDTYEKDEDGNVVFFDGYAEE